MGGIPEIVEDGKNGYLVAPESAKEIADTLVEMLNNRDRLCKMGDYGRHLAVEKFSWNQVAKNTLSVYKQVLKTR